MARISVPATGPLPSTIRLSASNPTITKLLTRLNRPSLLSLVLDWLDDNNVALCTPFIQNPDAEDDNDPTDLYSPASSLDDLRDLYTDMQARKGSKREVLDRILEGDWRHGLTLYQLSMADLQHLYDHPTSQRWTAYRIVPLKTKPDAELSVDAESLAVPRFHPSTFLQSLQAQALPDVKAQYNFDRPKDMALLLLRIFILDSPYNTSLATGSDLDTSRTVYIAFPDGSPYVYISKPQSVGPAAAGEAKSLRALIVEGVPKALSRPKARYKLEPTSLTTRNLREMLHIRGPGRTNAAGGGWGIFADEIKKQSPLDAVLPSPPLSEVDEGTTGRKAGNEPLRKRVFSPEMEREERRAKRAQLIAQARFGDSAKIDDGKGVERVDVVIDDPFPEEIDSEIDTEEDGDDRAGASSSRPRGGRGRQNVMDAVLGEAREQDDEGGGEDGKNAGGTWRPSVKLTFHGSHVFAGIRQLVEAGIIDGEKMPGWLTGEEGVTVGAVKHGRIRGHNGSGI